jgi:hypothetical protein
MVILSTTHRNIAFDSLRIAELHGIEHVTDNVCVLSEGGKVLSFKRKGQPDFTRITKQADVCDTPPSKPTC